MSEKQLMRRLRKITAVVVVISILLFLGGGFITSSLGRVQKDTMTTQMISEAEEYKANVLRKIKMDQQTLQTLASFFRFSNTISMIDTDAFANGLYESKIGRASCRERVESEGEEQRVRRSRER